MSYPILKPNSSWFAPTVSNINRGIITTINIVDTYTPSTTPTDSWDASIAQDGSIMCYVEDTILTIAGNGSGKISTNADASWTFSDVNNIDCFELVTAINGLSTLDTSNATTMKGMFYNFRSLLDIDVSSFNTSNVTNMSYLFAAPVTNSFKNYSDFPMNLKTIKFGSNFVTSKVTDISYILYYNTSLTELDIDDWDVSNVTSMYSSFFNCCNLTTFGENALANWNTGKVTNMEHAFRWLKKLTALNLEHWDVSNVKTFSYCFCNLAWTDVLDLEAWDISKCEDLSMMFHSCKTLTTLKVNTWDVRNVKTFDHFIAQMGSNFKNMDVSNWQVTNKCENLNAIFHGFKGTTLDVSGWDTSNVTVFTQMFDGCSNLTEIKGLQDLNTSNGRDFNQMFISNKIKHLDLSFIDTRKATPDYPLSKNGTHGTGMSQLMYGNWNNLEKITIGPNLSFDGDGSCIENVEIHHDGYPDEVEVLNCRFTIPKSKTGYWYSLDGTQYLNTDIPDDTAGVYFRNLADAIKEAEGKKYVSYNTLKHYNNKIKNLIEDKADKKFTITTPNEASVIMEEIFGEGPYTFEFTESSQDYAVAADVQFNPSNSGLEATNVQAAIDEIIHPSGTDYSRFKLRNIAIMDTVPTEMNDGDIVLVYVKSGE